MERGGLYLGLDVGTQGTKGLVLDAATGAVLARAERSYGLIAGLEPGACEQHPETWAEAAESVLRSLLAGPGVEAGALQGIGVSGQQHGFVPLDAEGRVIRPAKLWCDVATSEEVEELSRLFGRRVPTGFTASKILWMKRREPEGFSRLATVLLPHDYLGFLLTGRRVAEAGDASGTGLFDVVRRGWDEAAAALVDPGLPGALPELLAPGAPAGRVTAAAARRFGLPEGLLVAAGGGDNMMSALGAGAVRPGVVVASLGTSGTIFARHEAPLIDPEGLIAAFCDSAGAWLPLLCVMNATVATEAVRALVGARGARELDGLTAAAAELPLGSEGLTFVPFLNGERVPDLPRATGTILGLRAGTMTPAHLFRAAMEGVGANLALGLRRMSALGLGVGSVRLVGGGSRNDLWAQILADLFGRPVEPLDEPETAALGAALQAVWTRARLDDPELAVEDAIGSLAARPRARLVPDPGRAAAAAALLGRFEAALPR